MVVPLHHGGSGLRPLPPLVADVGPTRASLVTYLVPLVAVTVGVVVLDEPFHLRVLAGGPLIVGGIALVSWRRVAPAPTEAPPVGDASR